MRVGTGFTRTGYHDSATQYSTICRHSTCLVLQAWFDYIANSFKQSSISAIVLFAAFRAVFHATVRDSRVHPTLFIVSHTHFIDIAHECLPSATLGIYLRCVSPIRHLTLLLPSWYRLGPSVDEHRYAPDWIFCQLGRNSTGASHQ